jgi:hypothetical protein
MGKQRKTSNVRPSYVAESIGGSAPGYLAIFLADWFSNLSNDIMRQKEKMAILCVNHANASRL